MEGGAHTSTGGRRIALQLTLSPPPHLSPTPVDDAAVELNLAGLKKKKKSKKAKGGGDGGGDADDADAGADAALLALLDPTTKKRKRAPPPPRRRLWGCCLLCGGAGPGSVAGAGVLGLPGAGGRRRPDHRRPALGRRLRPRLRVRRAPGARVWHPARQQPRTDGGEAAHAAETAASRARGDEENGLHQLLRTLPRHEPRPRHVQSFLLAELGRRATRTRRRG